MAKILYLSPYFWPEEIGSSPYSIDLAVWLKQHGNDVQVVAFRPHYPSPDLFLPWADGTRDQEQYEGVAITRVAVRERGAGGALARLRNDLSYLWSVLRWALTGKFSGTDTVFVYVPSVLGVYGARVVKWITKARVIAVVHDIESGLAAAVGLVNNRTIIRGMQLFERIGLNGADHVVVLTEGMKTALRAIGCKKPIDVISIWAELVPYVRPDRNKPFQILYSGNFGKKQGFFQLLPALQRISDENLPVTVVLRGGGSEKQALMDAITRRGIRNVVFDALVPKEKFIAALQAAHVSCSPGAGRCQLCHTVEAVQHHVRRAALRVYRGKGQPIGLSRTRVGSRLVRPAFREWRRTLSDARDTDEQPRGTRSYVRRRPAVCSKAHEPCGYPATIYVFDLNDRIISGVGKIDTAADPGLAVARMLSALFGHQH